MAGTSQQHNSSERESGQQHQSPVQHPLQADAVTTSGSCGDQRQDQCEDEQHVDAAPERQTEYDAPQQLPAQQFAQERPTGDIAMQTQAAQEVEPKQDCGISQVAEQSSDMHVDSATFAGMPCAAGQKEQVVVVESTADKPGGCGAMTAAVHHSSETCWNPPAAVLIDIDSCASARC